MSSSSGRFPAQVEQTIQRYADTLSFGETIRPADQMRAHEGATATEAMLPATSMLAAGSLLADGDLEVQNLIAEGGMGRVILASQRSLQRDVAVKTVRPDMREPGLCDALHAEGVITGSLEHPNIIPVHALNVDSSGQPLLVMKRVDGVAWSELVADPDHPGWKRVTVVDEDRLAVHLAIFSAVCNAIYFANRQGVIHRDIKPDNVMLGELGDVYVVDWGIATSTSTSDPRFRRLTLGFVGTPGFIAPEMIGNDGGTVDARTDVYLLGSTLHNVLTGRMRHEGNNLMHTFALSAESEPALYDADVPEELGRIANRACARDPSDRFQIALELRDAIAQFLRHRASITLSDNASARLEEVKALRRADPQDGVAVDQDHLRKLETACKYGFVHALESWSGNERAKAGLRECALLAVRDEIARRNLGAAESLLREVEDPPADVMQAVEELREEARARALRDERFAELERQSDWRHGAGARVAFFAGFVGLALALWLFINEGHLRYPGTHSPQLLATNAGAIFLFICGAVFAGRRWLLTTQVNSRLVYGVLVTGAAIFVNRLLYCVPVPGNAALISTEILLCAYGAALGALMLARWLWLQVAFFLAGAIAARLMPSVAGFCFAVSGIASLGAGAWMLHTRGAASPAPDEASDGAASREGQSSSSNLPP